MRKTHIVVHHSLTADSGTVSWDAIRRYHIQTNGWEDIGYHYGIELVGSEYEVMVGRMPDEDGAHCKELGMNRVAYGICCVGNFDQTIPPYLMMDKLIGLMLYLMRQDHIPAERVWGHREIGLQAGFDWRLGQYKTCPGVQFDMGRLRAILAGAHS